MDNKLVEFLSAAYFGNTDSSDQLFDSCSKKAYLDLSRNIPYKYSLSELEKKDANVIYEYSKKKDSFKKEIFDFLMRSNHRDTDPMDCILRVCEIADNQYGDIFSCHFCVGLAQKWVNMTYKYLWLFNECNIVETNLHAPLDGYIIYALTHGNGKNIHGMSMNINGLNPDLKWSKLDNESLYMDIQNGLMDQIKNSKYASRVEWENLAWIEQSKIE